MRKKIGILINKYINNKKIFFLGMIDFYIFLKLLKIKKILIFGMIDFYIFFILLTLLLIIIIITITIKTIQRRKRR